jgi:hypothetical protein
MLRKPLYYSGLLLVLLSLSMACDTLEEDAATTAPNFDYAGGSVVYALPGSPTVISLQDRIPNTTASFSIQITSQPQRGQVQVDPQGLFVYRQQQGFTEGSDYIGYTITQNGAPLAAEYITIVVSANTGTFPCNAGAMADSISLFANSTDNLLPVLQNDRICSGSSTENNIIKSPNGQIHWNGSSFVYTPFPGFEGIDSFIYQLCQTTNPADAQATPGTCSYGYVTLHVLNEMSCRPEAADDAFDLHYYGNDTTYQLAVLTNDNWCQQETSLLQLQETLPHAGVHNDHITYTLTESTFTPTDTLNYSLCQNDECESARAVLSFERK